MSIRTLVDAPRRYAPLSPRPAFGTGVTACILRLDSHRPCGLLSLAAVFFRCCIVCRLSARLGLTVPRSGIDRCYSHCTISIFFQSGFQPPGGRPVSGSVIRTFDPLQPPFVLTAAGTTRHVPSHVDAFPKVCDWKSDKRSLLRA